jgi:23S rRNA pseudouridine1911/1915/1917 synthase
MTENKQPLVVYEDRDILIVAKPSGLHSVSNSEKDLDSSPSVATWLLARSPELRTVSERPLDAGLVNRLDFETSGLLLGAKTANSHTLLRAAIQRGEILKEYLAILEGEIESKFDFEGYIGSPNRHAQKMRVFTSKPATRMRALPGRTSYERIGYRKDLDLSLSRIEAHTARRHQIRAHSGFVGHPLIGDSLYGSKREARAVLADTEQGSIPTFFLHAHTLSLKHPESGEQLSFVCATPGYFRILFSSLSSDSPGGRPML